MLRRLLAFGLTLGLSHDPSCGGVDSPSGGLFAPCTRDKDCSDGLVCHGGVCTQPDAAAPSDASSDAATDSEPTDAGDGG